MAGGSNGGVYRFNGMTGAFLGVFISSSALRYSWGIGFDKNTNDTFVANMLNNGIMKFSPVGDGMTSAAAIEATLSSLPNLPRPMFAGMWSSKTMRHVRSFALTEDSMYVTSPSLGYVAAQYNRSNAVHKMSIEDVEPVLKSPSDIRVYNNYLYLCGDGEVRKYNRFDGEYLGVFSKMDMACSFMIFHDDYEMPKGN